MTKTLLKAQTAVPVGDMPLEFAAFVKTDLGAWKNVATRANVPVK